MCVSVCVCGPLNTAHSHRRPTHGTYLRAKLQLFASDRVRFRDMSVAQFKAAAYWASPFQVGYTCS